MFTVIVCLCVSRDAQVVRRGQIVQRGRPVVIAGPGEDDLGETNARTMPHTLIDAVLYQRRKKPRDTEVP